MSQQQQDLEVEQVAVCKTLSDMFFALTHNSPSLAGPDGRAHHREKLRALIRYEDALHAQIAAFDALDESARVAIAARSVQHAKEQP